MLQKNFTIYRSSAGSGKTYTLAREYLLLILKNPERYKNILAVTFTNKATQEMKDRILDYLHALSVGKAIPLQRELLLKLGLDEESLKSRAQIALKNILHDYSYFAVTTIDSFFQKILRTFAREIGLQSGFKLELDQEKVLEEVVDMLLSDIGKDAALKNWLVQYAKEKVEAGRSWDISKDIKELGREIFKEDFKAIEKDIIKLNQDPKLIAEFTDKLYGIKKYFEATVKSYGEQACRIMNEFELEVGDFSYGTGGVMGYLYNLCHKVPSPPKVRAKQALNSLEGWYTKKSGKKEAIATAVNSGLNDTLAAVVALFEKEYKKYETASHILKYIYTYGILSNISKKLEEYRDENSLLLISDATAFLKEIIAENDAPFIYERTGSFYKHFLIDEFQDTSRFQWANFRPLIINSLSEGNPNLVVGDIKQSIYRWRGGDWKLLLEDISNDVGGEHTQVLNLNTNWRSKKHIIDFNNSLFNVAPQVLSYLAIKRLQESEHLQNDDLRQRLIAEASKIALAYEDVHQLSPDVKITDENFAGYVYVSFFDSSEDNISEDNLAEDDESKGWKEEVKRRIPLLLEKIQDKGYSLKDVAILVRNKKEGKEIADCILEYKNSPQAKEGYVYEVISSEALFLSGVTSTNILINALRIISNYDDDIYKVHLAYDYQNHVLQNENISLGVLFGQAVKNFTSLLPFEFGENFSSLAKLPLYELIEELIRIFGLSGFKGELAYIQSFQDMALNFIKNEKPDITSFLEYWDERGCRQSVSISDKLDAVKILTIHKSKGLQFKNVIVPYCDWSTDHNTVLSNILWCNSDEPPFNEVSFLPLKYTSKLEETVYQKSYFEELIKAQMDYLNILYVAFTRAEEALYAFGEKPKISNKGEIKVKCMSSLLFYIFNKGYLEDKMQIKSKTEDILASENIYWKTEQSIFEIGKENMGPKPESKIEETRSSPLDHYISTSWRKKLEIKTRPREFFSRDSREKINYGNVVHQVLSVIQTESQIPSVLNELYYKGNIEKNDIKIIEGQINLMLENPVVRSWFTGEWEVKTEAPVLPLSGKLRRFDRVMIKNEKAIVVDFKSGLPFKSHRRQIIEYADLLRQMNYKDVEGYLVYLADAVVEKVV